MRRLPNHTVERLEQRFALPVLLAALASVPATFLTMLEGGYAELGNAVNWLSLAVLTAESVVPFALTTDRPAWLRTHWPVLVIALAAIPAVLFAVGPVQALRLLRFVGALRILRVRRILRAGRVLRDRLGAEHKWARLAVGGATASAALFVALVLADPTSTSRRLVDSVLGRFGALPALLAGTLVAAATFVLARRSKFQRGEEQKASPDPVADGVDRLDGLDGRDGGTLAAAQPRRER